MGFNGVENDNVFGVLLETIKEIRGNNLFLEVLDLLLL
jgi:hypothetical protein